MIGVTHPYRGSGFVAGNCGKSRSLIQAITLAGKTSGLRFAVDAGDINSWPGSGETLFDTSGNNEDFWLGTDGTGTYNPTFNPSGIAGNRSCTEYFSLNGTGLFKMKSGLPAWANTMHKDSAQFALFYAFYQPAIGDAGFMFSTGSGDPNTGICAQLTPTAFGCVGAMGGEVLYAYFPYSLWMAGAWNFMGFYIDEINSNGFMWLNGQSLVDKVVHNGVTINYIPDQATFNGDGYYTTPSAASADGSVVIGGPGNPISPVTGAGTLFSTAAAWTGAAFTAADFDAIYNEIKKRYALP